MNDERVRFHLDENVDPAIAEGLRRRGADVTTSQDAGLLNATDDEQIAYSTDSGRVLVTHDEGFLAIAKGRSPHSGMAYCHIQSRSIGEVIAGLMLIRDCMTPEEMHDHVEFL
jgi:predicted nuclease of predicted toxin-antitoxin system